METHRYTTLAEVFELVRQNRQLQITCSKTGEDITKKVLVRAIMEMQVKNADLLTMQEITETIQTAQTEFDQLVNERTSDKSYNFME